MKNSSFHSNFKLNGNSFESKEELVRYAATTPHAVFLFLRDWFSEKPTLSLTTSGSIGTPKEIELKKRHMIHSAKTTGRFFNLPENTTALLCLSADYIAGKMMLVRAMVLGWHLDIVKTDANPLKNTSKTYDFSAMIPMQLRNSLQDIHRVKKLIVGGGAVDIDLERAIQKISTQVFATYGMTETSTHIAVKKLNHFKNSEPSSKHYEVLPDITISKDNRSCLVIDAPKISDTPLITNDIVEIITPTQFNWKGRCDYVINSGGIKLHPEEIERKLAPQIKRRFFVAGMHDKLLGEKLILLIEGTEFHIPKETYSNLNKYEIPKKIYFIPQFKETETGKIQRIKILDSIVP
ncbi:MAG: AMP-binding protein [Flavobacteriaceae bacterium]|nr:MAG: AMP-binding protein [Flavobacteriaceae bacterium]